MDKILTFEKGENLYDILGCPESASKEQIATEYRQKVRKCHPDKVQAGVSDISGNRETTSDEIADEKSKEYDRLRYAYDILNDDNKRRDYDKWLHSGLCISYEGWLEKQKSGHFAMHFAASSKGRLMITEIGQETEKKKIVYPKATRIDNHLKRRHFGSSGRSKFQRYEI